MCRGAACSSVCVTRPGDKPVPDLRTHYRADALSWVSAPFPKPADMSNERPIKLLVTGGSRSGKSAHAEATARALARTVSFIATARVDDEEMSSRIVLHRQRRPEGWTTIEEPIALSSAIADALRERGAERHCIVIDCVTLWLFNVLGLNEMSGPDNEPPLQIERLERERLELLAAVRDCPAHLVIVTNELGSGVVPMGRLTRRFVDEHGWTNQRLAAACDQVVFTVSGIPVTIKPAGRAA